MLLTGCVVAPIGPPRQVVVRTAPPPPVVVSNAPLYFYPGRAQTEALQDRDRYECYRWAVRQTGTDPGMTPLRLAQAAPSRGGPPPAGSVTRATRADARDVLGGAATGAVLGAALSSPRNAGNGAVLGAIFGAAVGAAASDARNRAIDAAQSRADLASRSAQLTDDPFRRAMAACMQGRGYTVR